MLRCYEELDKDELRRELEVRGVKDYPKSRKGKVDNLKDKPFAEVVTSLLYLLHTAQIPV